ncbi:hypothetical protein AAH994_08740 [Weeksellaceae bacterium A-14]
MMYTPITSTTHVKTAVRIKIWTIVIAAPFLLAACSKHFSKENIDAALIEKNEELRIQGKTEQVISLNKKYIKISKQQRYTRGEILGYINIANTYAATGNYKKAKTNLNKARELLAEMQDEYLRTRLYHEYGQLNFVMGLPNVALKYNSKAIYYSKKIRPASEYRRLISNLYTVRADFIRDQYPDSTLVYFKKGLQIDNSDLNNAVLGNYYSTTLAKQDSARYYLEKAIQLLDKEEYYTIRRGIVYWFYGHFLLGEKEYTKAQQYYIKSADVLEKTQ